MTPSKQWEQWEGQGYPSTKDAPVIYYYPGKVDIEKDDNMDDLVRELHFDGIAPTKSDARLILEDAVVVHGLVVDIDGELHCYFGPKYEFGEEGYRVTHEATWVEVDEYED